MFFTEKIYSKLLTFISTLFCSVCMYASLPTNNALPRRNQRYLSSARRCELRYAFALDSLISRYQNWHYEGADTLSNPYYASLFGTPMLYGGTLQRMIANIDTARVPAMITSSQHAYDIVSATDNLVLQTYMQHPWYVLYEEPKRGTVDVDAQIRQAAKPDVSLTERFAEKDRHNQPPTELPDDDEWGIVVRKPNFWTLKANLSLQFTQSYVSDNWYKGGESNNALLASTVLEANYNNHRKITFDNKLEMKLGFQSSHNDDEHKYKTNSDLIRLTNKLGLKAVNHWNYAVMLQSWTQFYRGYKANDPKIYSDFMSPFESLLSLGMDYQFTSKNKKFKLTATLSPFALKLLYVNRPSLATTFGLSEGHHTDWTYGSNITVNYSWQIVKNVAWTGRIYWFTDYSNTQLEWENTFNLTINRYLSAKLFIYPRFDDNVVRKEGQSYFQFNELLSLGFNIDF